MGDDDEDRKAILARRNRFIAIALSGLTSAVAPACGDEAEPTPEVADPQPCLTAVEMIPLEEPKPEPPTPVDPVTPQDEVEDETAMMDDGTMMQTGMMRPRPRVCLRRIQPPPPIPGPCLTPPRVCLSEAFPGMRDNPPPPPPPQPCLEPPPQVCLDFKTADFDDDDEDEA